MTSSVEWDVSGFTELVEVLEGLPEFLIDRAHDKAVEISPVLTGLYRDSWMKDPEGIHNIDGIFNEEKGIFIESGGSAKAPDGVLPVVSASVPYWIDEYLNSGGTIK